MMVCFVLHKDLKWIGANTEGAVTRLLPCTSAFSIRAFSFLKITLHNTEDVICFILKATGWPVFF